MVTHLSIAQVNSCLTSLIQLLAWAILGWVIIWQPQFFSVGRKVRQIRQILPNLIAQFELWKNSNVVFGKQFTGPRIISYCARNSYEELRYFDSLYNLNTTLCEWIMLKFCACKDMQSITRQIPSFHLKGKQLFTW